MLNEKTKIFLAGHNGFLGKSIHEYFLKKNLKVLTIEKKKLDLRNREHLKRYFKKIKPDIVINAAGKVGGIKANMTNNAEFLDENYLIQSSLIFNSFECKVKKFINIASSCIYPTCSKQPIKESYLLDGKLEITNEGYALSKIAGLKLCKYLNEQYNFNTLTLIPCNLYGENDKFNNDDSHFLPGLISKINHAKINNLDEVYLWGSGKPKRELMHVTDLSRAIYFFTKRNNINKRIINIGTGKDYTIKQYAMMIKEHLKYFGKINWNTKYPDGMKRKLLDVSLMNNLGFKTTIKFENNLKNIISNFRKNF